MLYGLIKKYSTFENISELRIYCCRDFGLSPELLKLVRESPFNYGIRKGQRFFSSRGIYADIQRSDEFENEISIVYANNIFSREDVEEAFISCSLISISGECNRFTRYYRIIEASNGFSTEERSRFNLFELRAKTTYSQLTGIVSEIGSPYIAIGDGKMVKCCFNIKDIKMLLTIGKLLLGNTVNTSEYYVRFITSALGRDFVEKTGSLKNSLRGDEYIEIVGEEFSISSNSWKYIVGNLRLNIFMDLLSKVFLSNAT